MALVPCAAGAQVSAWSQRPVERLRNPLVGRADLGGRVFEDRNGNGRFDRDEVGLRDVTVALDDGRFAVTGVDGRYQLAEISPGQRAVALREGTLPTGATAAVTRAVLEVPPGAFVRVDFPITLHTETVRIGRAQRLGYEVFPTLEEAPVNVVGNATDLQALLNGRRLGFPRADVEVRGLARGGYARTWRSVKLRLTQRYTGAAEGWEASLVAADGRTLRTWTGRGTPPRTLDLDGRDAQGRPMEGPLALAVRLCVDYAPATRACSPYRPFGLLGKGARPKLEIPEQQAAALVQGEKATLDPDGSFIFPARPDEARRITVSLTRADGRHTSAVATVPAVTPTAPTAAFPIEWDRTTDLYAAPPRPGTLTVFFTGTVPEGARLQVGQEPLPVQAGRFRASLPVPLGRSRFELTLTTAEGWNTIYELSFLLGDRTPEGAPIVTQEKIPELELELPPASTLLTRDTLRVRGRAEAGATVVANGLTLATGGGAFDALVPVDPASGELKVTISDGEGHHGEIARRYGAHLGTRASLVWGDAEPFLRFVHSGGAGGDDLRRGFVGALRGGGQTLAYGNVNGFGDLSISSLDRRPAPPLDEGTGAPPLVAPPSPWASASVFAGAEKWFGSGFVVGLRYDGAVFWGPDEGDVLPMRHDGTLSAAILSERFDVLLDGGVELDQGYVGPQVLLAGGGLGVRWRATRTLDVRARAGALLAVTDVAEGDKPEIVDASAQVSWRPLGGQVLSLRLSHLEDNRALNPEATGEVTSLALTLPLGSKLVLVEVLGAWFVRGGVTGLNVTRLEAPVAARLLFAIDYRLQTQFDVHEHAVRVEGNYFLASWLRVGALYQLDKVSGGGELSSRAQARIQAVF